MAKEIAIGKRAKISEAQQYMLLAVVGASMFLGVAICLILHFIKQISFNTEVIMEEEKSIANYSKIIESTGVCKKPAGSIYSDAELEKCNPDSIEPSQVPGTLRSNILENVAANTALASVPREDNDSCKNKETGKYYTYKELKKQYDDSYAKGQEAVKTASQLMKSCSALRVIPEALPAFKNEEALLASLNRIFLLSGWEPESISPGGSSSSTTEKDGVNDISVSLSVESDSATTLNVIHNIERSIREFDINQATIEWGSNDTLLLNAKASAYYRDKSTIQETTKTIKGDNEQGGKKK